MQIKEMVGCSAYNCTGKGKSLFTFPENPIIRRQWIRNTKRENFNPELMELTGIRFKLKFKADAVPTEFDFSSPKFKCNVKGKRPYLGSRFASKFQKQLEPSLSPRKGPVTAASKSKG